ncbi:MarR family winged helix-turn-helix transcriptional regulator [Paenibacillus harenae]|uniref:MarR family winged helix-turn-helix transcriptional regulator n=1 Tax=Paenibacillus harenae TaxID=306543 RepID=UPI00278EE480|nr:MarR family winged helix-turn-helix transcriptional regulator [Paenibacillus harenae]MDQ0062684.1 DNA-binding MarR family transcriptional regulator [Paenibacillus harenae]
MEKKELFQQLIAFITDVHQMKHNVTKGFSIEDITPAQYGILEFIAVSQPVTVSEISECKDMSMPNTSRELKKLIDKSLCWKYDADEDKRKQYVRLAPKGEELMGNVFAHMENWVGERVRGLSGEELEQLSQAMELLRSTIFRIER